MNKYLKWQAPGVGITVEKDKISITQILFDDESVRKKLTVMDKWDVICDDARNTTEPGFSEVIEQFLKLGRMYRLSIEDIGEAPDEKTTA